jgi:CMP-N,N'-diacetyllegionaminic acid synthase
MRVLALVPARGASKRLPGKNIRLLGGRPLIDWSIDVTKGIADICDVLVSTDDLSIAKVAKTAGALVPWLRPAELATDTSTSAEVSLHALNWYESAIGPIDGLMLLQPTSPFRTKQTVLRGIELFRANQGRPVVAVSPAESHPIWCYRIEGNKMRPFIQRDGLILRSQDLPPAYRLNGGLYLVTPAYLRNHKSLHGDDMVPLPLEEETEGLDIDTEWDWGVAEMAMQRLKAAGGGLA